MREKTMKRQKGNARRSLRRDFFEDPGVPLPYGCSNLAEVFMDVNEMYTLSALPGVDWAQSRPSSHQSLGIELRRAMVRFPDNGVDKRALNVFEKTATEPTRVSESFSELGCRSSHWTFVQGVRPPVLTSSCRNLPLHTRGQLSNQSIPLETFAVWSNRRILSCTETLSSDVSNDRPTFHNSQLQGYLTHSIIEPQLVKIPNCSHQTLQWV